MALEAGLIEEGRGALGDRDRWGGRLRHCDKSYEVRECSGARPGKEAESSENPGHAQETTGKG